MYLDNSMLCHTEQLKCTLLIAATVLLDARKVHGLLRAARPEAEGQRPSPRLTLHNFPVCGWAFRKLLGVGTQRYKKLQAAAREERPAPLDGRFVCKRRRMDKPSASRIRVVEFLEELYNTAAEPMPTVNSSAKGCRPSASRTEDTPQEAVQREQDRRPINRRLAFRRPQGRRPNLFRIQDERKRQKMNTAKLRVLPPGSFTEYLQLLNARLGPGQKRVTKKLFNSAVCLLIAPSRRVVVYVTCFEPWCLCKSNNNNINNDNNNVFHSVGSKVWAESFSDKLTIREHGNHSVCGICVRHKLILRKLGEDRAAHRKQMVEFGKHLNRQFNDRVVYWQSRAASRLLSLPDGSQSIVCICDSMDHTKFSWPRSVHMIAKDFSAFQRPSLDCTGLLWHGHLAMLAVSESWVQKLDSGGNHHALI